MGRDLEATADWLTSQLPECFRGVSCVAQVTGSAGSPAAEDAGKADRVRLRLWFWLSSELHGAQLEALAGVGRDRPWIDAATFRDVQEIFTADPIFADGIPDPIETRLALIRRGRDFVIVPDDLPDWIERSASSGGNGRQPDGLEFVELAPEDVDRREALATYRERLGSFGDKRGEDDDRFKAAILAGRLGIAKATAAEIMLHFATKVWPIKRGRADVNKAIENGWWRGRQEARPRRSLADVFAGYKAKAAEAALAKAARLPAKAAQAELDAKIAAWIEEGGTHAIRATTGLGKSTALIAALAAHREQLKGAVILYLVPTHRLSAEIAEAVEAAGLSARIIRGRINHADIANSPCKKAETAEIVQRAGLSVSTTMCKSSRQSKDGGPAVVTKCAFYDTCLYNRQFKNTEGKVLIASHEQLANGNEKLPKATHVIIDETFWPKMIRRSSWISIDMLDPEQRYKSREHWVVTECARRLDFAVVGEKPHTKPSKATRKLLFRCIFGSKPAIEEIHGPAFCRVVRQADEIGKRHDEVLAAVRAALSAGEHPRQHDVTRGELERMASSIYAASLGSAGAEVDEVGPESGKEAQRAAAAQFAKGKPDRTLSSVFRVLAADYELEHLTQRVEVVAKAEGGVKRLGLRVHSRETLKGIEGAAVLILDADFEREIVERFLPVDKVTTIDAELQCRVVQVGDRSCSMAALTTRESAPRRRREIGGLLRRKVSDGRKVLLVTYKSVLAPDDGPPLLEVPDQADGTWFGGFRGVDDYKDHDTAIIAGRNQLPPEAAEGQARALFGDQGELYLPGQYEVDEAGNHYHPDRRVQLVVRQSREAETGQAIGRLRLVHRKTQAEIILLPKLPIPGFEPDEVVTWKAIVGDRFSVAAGRGHGIELLSPAELSRCFPTLWPTKGAAEQDQRRRQGETNKPTFPYKESILGSVGLSTGRECTYRTVAGSKRGKPFRALIPIGLDRDEAEARAALTAVVGELTAFAWIDPPIERNTAEGADECNSWEHDDAFEDA